MLQIYLLHQNTLIDCQHNTETYCFTFVVFLLNVTYVHDVLSIENAKYNNDKKNQCME